MNNYLIPANSKNSQLILGLFTPIDLVIFLVGLAFTLVMLLTIHTNSLSVMILILLPLLISTFLILPVPHYHNVLQLLTNVITFFMNKRRYYWRGWSIYERFNTNDKRF